MTTTTIIILIVAFVIVDGFVLYKVLNRSRSDAGDAEPGPSESGGEAQDAFGSGD